MNVLVTGATGFVGGHLVDRLLERGDSVTALVRSRARAAELERRGVRLVVGDLSNAAALDQACAGQEAVCHAAAILGASAEDTLTRANRDGTANLVRACEAQATPPQFVFVSSMAAGGPSRRGEPRAEPGEDHPVTMYGRSKLAAERVVTASSLRWCVVRAPVVYGPRDREGLLPVFKAIQFGVAPYFGDGTMELSLVHAADLADALTLAATEPPAIGHTWYVASPEIVTSQDLLRAIARALHRTPVPIALPRWVATGALGITGMAANVFGFKSILHPDKIHEFFQEAWTADATPFMTATGWQPRWDLASGLADTAAWYRNARWI